MIRYGSGLEKQIKSGYRLVLPETINLSQVPPTDHPEKVQPSALQDALSNYVPKTQQQGYSFDSVAVSANAAYVSPIK